MTYPAVLVLEVEEENTSNMWYRITVRAAGTVLEIIETPTMQEALNKFNRKYRKISNEVDLDRITR